MTRDHTTGLIQNLRVRAAHPQLGDAYKRIDGDFGVLWVFEVSRLETGMVMIGLQAEGGIPRVYVALVDLLDKYEKGGEDAR